MEKKKKKKKSNVYLECQYTKNEWHRHKTPCSTIIMIIYL